MPGWINIHVWSITGGPVTDDSLIAWLRVKERPTWTRGLDNSIHSLFMHRKKLSKSYLFTIFIYVTIDSSSLPLKTNSHFTYSWSNTDYSRYLSSHFFYVVDFKCLVLITCQFRVSDCKGDKLGKDAIRHIQCSLSNLAPECTAAQINNKNQRLSWCLMF